MHLASFMSSSDATIEYKLRFLLFFNDQNLLYTCVSVLDAKRWNRTMCLSKSQQFMKACTCVFLVSTLKINR